MSANKLPNIAEKTGETFVKKYEKMRTFLKTPMGIATQIIIGFFFIFLIYWIALKVLHIDTLNAASFDINKKSETNIIVGFADSSQLAKQSYNTINTYAASYMPLNPSVNIKGGAQFTYSMWLFIGAPANAINKPIFMRGDAKKYWYTVKSASVPTPVSKNDYVAMCPLFEFGTNPMDFNIRFNTSNNINEILQIQGINSANSVYRKNMMYMLSSQWFTVSIVFEDNVPINDFENGLSVKFYVNGVLYQSATYSAMLKQNTGNLFLFPDGSIDNVKISNFRYYNYALGDQEIQTKMGTGPSSTVQSSVTQSFLQPLAMSDYNTLDIYNI